MNTPQKGLAPPAATITLRDVYYILFRHKWLIAILAALGVVGSTALFLLWPFPYTSEAKIFVRYIQETTGPSELETSAKVRMPDEHNNSILNTELQILTSKDLAFQVATNLGTERILGKSGDTNNPYVAANFISLHLKAEVQKDSDVIVLQFTAIDPMVVQPVLTELIKDYRGGYFEIHLAPGVSDTFLEQKRDKSKADLQNAMSALEDTKVKTGITSLDDAKKEVAELISKTRQNINDTRTDLVETQAAIKDIREKILAASGNKSTNTHSADLPFAPPAPPSAEVVSKYQDLLTVQNARRAAEQRLLGEFEAGSNPMMLNAQQQRVAAEKSVKAFEAQNPGLLALKPGDLSKAGLSLAPSADLESMLRDCLIKEHVLAAKYLELTNQLVQAQQQVAIVDGAENKIMEETSEKDAADAKYKRSVMNADQASIEAAMGNQVSNIIPIESPTPPRRDSKLMIKVNLGVLAFFFALAGGLPFFIERVLDQSLKTPLDVQARIGMPFFVNIPRTNGHAKVSKLKRIKEVPLLNAQNGETPGSFVEGHIGQEAANGQVAAWDERHELRPYFETLRDRLMTYFEMINLTHKPKLVAVTSCGSGAGVTTTAAGLASSLSEIGEGNVLLVSMNVRDGEAHHFYKGKLACGIEDVLEKKNRDQAQVHSNLFVAEELEADDRLPRVLPKRFSHLVPLMKASDYDYIIFDMPPVSEISITPRLARFMDMVLLVIESEKTSRDAATRVASLLADSKTNVGLVLNKNRSYMPKRLEQLL